MTLIHPTCSDIPNSASSSTGPPSAKVITGMSFSTSPCIHIPNLVSSECFSSIFHGENDVQSLHPQIGVEGGRVGCVCGEMLHLSREGGIRDVLIDIVEREDSWVVCVEIGQRRKRAKVGRSVVEEERQKAVLQAMGVGLVA
ncbi:hypothetical protein Hypma_007043 [Hypsizygus marmoreus]|uniref:Uncharacterized protein n=1 Tax=Hypsizygus marmoreus TaxID=39966 RepID=A0A369KFM1_HYPMA|nr:hypothetical protein Hypma_007043 [Hypsizygus marmoreus]